MVNRWLTAAFFILPHASGEGRPRQRVRPEVTGPMTGSARSPKERRRVRRPLHHPPRATRVLGWSPSPPFVGEDANTRPRSRDALCIRAVGTKATNVFASEQIKGGGAPVGATVSKPHRASRCCHPECASDAARATNDPLARNARFGRARLSALHRGSRQAVTPGSASGRVSWNHRVQTGGPSPVPVQ